MIIYDIKNNYIATNIRKISNNRIKGHIRQVEILKFLSVWKYATTQQLSLLASETEANVMKHVRKLRELGYLQLHRYRVHNIVEITRQGLELIEHYTGVSYDFLKSKEKFKKELIEHDLTIRDKAIQFIDYIQYPVKTSHFFKKLYATAVNKKYAEKEIRKLHIADFIVIRTDLANKPHRVAGIEYEHTNKKLKDVRRKIESMLKSIEYYSNYIFLYKNKNIMNSFVRKYQKLANKIDINYTIWNISNMDFRYEEVEENRNRLIIDKYIPIKDWAYETLKELVNDMIKIRKLEHIPELRKRLG